MDAVITYVDDLDPLWQAEYAAAAGMDTFLSKRFRDWGTLKYLLRGIETFMPFVKNVYLVVSGESQVPQWARGTELRIVTHREIIPEHHLPVFNSTAIEMYLHRIPGLDEEYVYFNDDMFPVMPCRREDFYVDGRSTMYFSRCRLCLGLYRRQTRNSDRLARKAAGLGPVGWYYRPQHSCSPMLKSSCEELSRILDAEIEASVSRLREEKNMNQYLFLDYMNHIGKTSPRRMSNRHFSLASASLSSIRDAILNPKHKFLCINDVRMSDNRFRAYREGIADAFESRFPVKSRFES